MLYKHQNYWTRMPNAILFIVIKLGKQLKYPKILKIKINNGSIKSENIL